MTTIYAVMNPKGGVGKSTTAINVSAVGSLLERNVLLIDMDPNMSTTKVFGLHNKLARSDYDRKNVSNLFKDNPSKPSELAISLDFGFDFIAGAFDLQDADLFLQTLRDGGLSWLYDLFEDDQGLDKYDEIIIDTGGRIGRIYTPICILADHILVPAEAAKMSLDQVEEIVPFVLEIAKDKKRYFRSTVDIAGIFFTKFRKGTNAGRENDEKLKTMMAGTGIKVAETKLPLATRVDDADSKGMPIVLLEPDEPIAHAFYSLYEELILGNK